MICWPEDMPSEQSNARRCGGFVRSVVSRLARLEQLNRLSTAPKRLRIQYGYLKTLPDDYIGPRHVVAVKQIPPEELPPTERAKPWFEWEERPGPERSEEHTSELQSRQYLVC